MSTDAVPLDLSYAHTPDADDAFMLYALTTGKVTSAAIKISDIVKPMQQLNLDALHGLHDISALSLGAYPQVSDTYSILPCGVCMGFEYGPTILANRPLSRDELKSVKIAVPGRMTTAYLMLRLFDPEIETVEMKFDSIPGAVKSGKVGAGLIIHEVQLTYEKWGFSKIVDLGQWWHEETGLPLPLGGNVIRRSFGEPMIREVTKLLRASIQYCLDHREEALTFAMRYARGLNFEEAGKFIGLYVNESTLDYGERGAAALEKMYGMAYEKGILDKRVTIDFAVLGKTSTVMA